MGLQKFYLVVALLFYIQIYIVTQQTQWELATGTEGVAIAALDITQDNADTLYAIGMRLVNGRSINGITLKSVNGGESWDSIASLGAASGALAVNPVNSKNVYLTGMGADFGSNNIYKTTDGGKTWKGVLTGRGYPTVVLQFDPQKNNVVYVGYDGVVTYSTDFGQTWEPIVHSGWACVATVSSQTTSWSDNTVSPAAKFDPLYTIKYKIKAVDLVNNNSDFTAEQSVTGTTNTFWKLAESSSNEFITDYKLFANYPNPFNPSTNIEFQIPRSSFVNLVVYNSLGEEVAVLVNQNLAEGKYSVDFRADNLSSGLYIYKLDASEFSSVKKMMLAK